MMISHWHTCSWEIDQANSSDWWTTINRRPALVPGQVSAMGEPDSALWSVQGHGGYTYHSGGYEFAAVVWRCDGTCTRR